MYICGFLIVEKERDFQTSSCTKLRKIFCFSNFNFIAAIISYNMQVFDTENALQLYKKTTKGSWGFVPTMGALHEGHLALLRTAQERHEHTICSIFVNPTQFNNPEDFAKYPQTLEKDLKLLEQQGCTAVFIPSISEIYPENFIQKKYELGILEKVMEGEMRPGHYQGVANVVHILLQKTRPNELFLGEKDYQQIQVIKRMMELEGWSIPIYVVPTVRTKTGLAMSSRNLRLSEKGLKQAAALFHVLQMFSSRALTGGVDRCLAQAKVQLIEQHGFEAVEYLLIFEENNLEKQIKILEKNKKYRIFAAAIIENVRLIDNLTFEIHTV